MHIVPYAFTRVIIGFQYNLLEIRLNTGLEKEMHIFSVQLFYTVMEETILTKYHIIKP